MKCPECNEEVDIPKDIMEGEILSCIMCGVELVYSNNTLKLCAEEGEDWGE